jgi:hypothetical protein
MVHETIAIRVRERHEPARRDDDERENFHNQAKQHTDQRRAAERHRGHEFDLLRLGEVEISTEHVLTHGLRHDGEDVGREVHRGGEARRRMRTRSNDERERLNAVTSYARAQR